MAIKNKMNDSIAYHIPTPKSSRGSLGIFPPGYALVTKSIKAGDEAAWTTKAEEAIMKETNVMKTKNAFSLDLKDVEEWSEVV